MTKKREWIPFLVLFVYILLIICCLFEIPFQLIVDGGASRPLPLKFNESTPIETPVRLNVMEPNRSIIDPSDGQ